MSDRLREIRLALRRLGRAPVFTVIAIVTLGTAIGANTAIFSVVDGVLLEPLRYPRPEELVRISHVAPGMGAGGNLPLSDALYFTYRDGARVFRGIGLTDEGAVTVTGTSAPERIRAATVTEGTLTLLEATPLLGRRFTAVDDEPGAPPTVILSHAYWRQRFGGDRAALGRNLEVDGVAHEIIGVLPEDFRLLELDPAVYLPARIDPARAQMMALRYQAIGRLAPGVGIVQANADLDRLIPVALARFPGRITPEQLTRTGFAANLKPLQEDVVGDVSTVLWVLLGTVGLVLVLACANVANLFLVRAESREREVAVRTALGAGRRRVIEGFLTESLVIGGIAGILGVVLAAGAVRVLRAVGPAGIPRIDEIGIDVTVLGFSAVISIGAGLLFGLIPALRYGRPDLLPALKEGGRGTGTAKGTLRTRNALVVVQVALALVLLIGSALMLRSVASLREVDPGFRRPEGVLTFRIFVPRAEVPDPARVVELDRQILERLAAVPGVTSVGGAWSTPMMPTMMSTPISVEEFPTEPGQIEAPRRHDVAAPGYFETLGTPILAGRTIGWDDVTNRSQVVVVNATLARAYWRNPADAIGKRIALRGSPEWQEIVGVVTDIRSDGVSQPAPPMVFWPLSAVRFGGEQARSLAVTIRTEGNPTTLRSAAEQAVWSIDRNLPLAEVRTLEALLEGSMARAAFAMVMLTAAAGVALVLGLVGIYGVISYVVSQRTREIGVRIALGARPGDVRRMVLGQAALVTGTGLVIGLAGAALLTRMMVGLLHGVKAVDPAIYLGTALATGVVALAASWLPTRRAVSIDPATALRD